MASKHQVAKQVVENKKSKVNRFSLFLIESNG